MPTAPWRQRPAAPQAFTKSIRHWHGWRDMPLTWDAQTPVAVAHAAADPVSAGVQGTEVHQLGTCRAGEACCAAAAEPQGAGALGVARPVIVTGAGGTRVHLLLACSTLVACKRGEAETRVGNGWTERERERKSWDKHQNYFCIYNLLLCKKTEAARTLNVIYNHFSKCHHVQMSLSTWNKTKLKCTCGQIDHFEGRSQMKLFSSLVISNEPAHNKVGREEQQGLCLCKSGGAVRYVTSILAWNCTHSSAH